MTQKLKKDLAALFSFLLILSFILSPSLFPTTVSAFSTAFSEYDGSFDYAAVSLEPKTTTQSGAPSASLSASELKSMKLYVGGIPFGVKFMTEGILIVGFCDVDQGGKRINPSSEAGLKAGDRIISINGKELISAAELTDIVAKSGGKTLSVEYLRGGSKYTAKLTPAYSQSEKCYKTGIYVKDNGAGIGTVTYIDPNTLSFGGLGHGICEGESGKLVPIQRGSVVNVCINGVVRGQCGTPGEVKGYFKAGKLGSLLKNTECGVFGVYASLPQNLPSEPLSLGLRNEVKEGKAYIWCTLDEGGVPQRYEIEISNIDRAASAGKCFNVKVTDQTLIAKTGGIVQGMSGSPIIQNGKLVGAVTHVLINDPTTGYGIFIENMLNAAQMPMQKAA